MVDTIRKKVILIMCSHVRQNARISGRFAFLLRISNDSTLTMLCGSTHNVCNDESELNGMPYNRAIWDSDGYISDVIAGPMVIVGLGEEDFCGLSHEMAEKYMNMFRVPEQFSYIGGRLVVTEAEPRKSSLEQHAAEAKEEAKAQWKADPIPQKDYSR